MPERLAAECSKFYEVLGFAPVKPPKSLLHRALWLQGDSTQIHLQHTDREGKPVDAAPPTNNGHVAIVVTNYETVIGALRAAGVSIDERSSHWNAARCYVRDPAGNVLELMESPPE